MEVSVPALPAHPWDIAKILVHLVQAHQSVHKNPSELSEASGIFLLNLPLHALKI